MNIDHQPSSALEDDPRAALAAWANGREEWVRYLVRHILRTGRPLHSARIDEAYQLLRQENGLEPRELPREETLIVNSTVAESGSSFRITKLSEVRGVNALMQGEVIEPHEGMTILFGENGTGKTGYTRIFKALAGSRSADTVLGDIASETPESQSARVDYVVDDEAGSVIWSGEVGVSPFKRMSVFDNPAVTYHVDDDLEYVYIPNALALYEHANVALAQVQERLDSALKSLETGQPEIVTRISNESEIYPLIEALGPGTDLARLYEHSYGEPDAESRLAELDKQAAQIAVGALGEKILQLERRRKALGEAVAVATALSDLDVATLNGQLERRRALRNDYRQLRDELFNLADLPAEPEDTWEVFVVSGDQYRQHLVAVGAHDDTRCLYCRQVLTAPARDLIAKYGDYLGNEINKQIDAAGSAITSMTDPLTALSTAAVETFLEECEGQDEPPTIHQVMGTTLSMLKTVVDTIRDEALLDGVIPSSATELLVELREGMDAAETRIAELREQDQNRSAALDEKKRERINFAAAVELAKSWPAIESYVSRARETDQLERLRDDFSTIKRSLTARGKAVSSKLLNDDFGRLFAEECDALRAPALNVKFIDRDARTKRHRRLAGGHKPSLVLSEGEQKVLALADFLAEANLSGDATPVLFDDPVSSLDHRRVNEVAQRIARLAEHRQVVVFTHDVFFAATLLGLFEGTDRCSYFQITDDEGKGHVAQSSGPRWDTVKSLAKKINITIDTARGVDGDARAALVREGYSWIRAWCEVVTETELLQGVSQRYQPNIHMTVLPKINAGALPDAVAVILPIFEEAASSRGHCTVAAA